MLKRLIISICLFSLCACHSEGSLYCELNEDPFITMIRLDHDYKRITSYHEEVMIDLEEIDQDVIEEYIKDLENYQLKGTHLHIYFDFELSDPVTFDLFSDEEYSKDKYFHLDKSHEEFLKRGFTCQSISN